LFIQNLFLGYLTALLQGETWFVLSVTICLSFAATIMSIRWKNASVLFAMIVLVSLTHLLWSINNPLLGNTVKFAEIPAFGLFCVLLYAGMVAIGDLIRGQGQEESFLSILLHMLNSMLSYGLFSFLLFMGFPQQGALWQFIAALVMLGVSFIAWVWQRRKYSTFIYAMIGSCALSVSILQQVAIPEAFVWLCWQSVLMMSVAIWFHSRLMIMGNFFIYLAVFVAYLLSSSTMSAVSISFGIVALLSARILNWQKDRLELRTEMIRNAYLFSALLFLPYALYHILTPGIVSLSWLALAFFYYIASRFLKNRKYRWMALLTMSLTVIRVLFIDLIGVDPLWRIISFIVLGSALLTISMYYSRSRRKNEAPISN
jgi:hypothetical protein